MGLKALKIKTKLILFCLILVVLVSSIFVFSNRISQSILAEFITNQDTYHSVNSLNINLRKCRSTLSAYMRESDARYLLDFYDLKETTDALLKPLTIKASNKEEHLLSRALVNLCEEYYENGLEVISLFVHHDESCYLQFYYGDKILDYIYQYTSQYLQAKLSNDSKAYLLLTVKVKNVEKISYTVLVSIIAVCIVFIFIFSSYIANPINQLIEISSEMSKGDLNVRKIDVKSYNEVGLLVKSFNHMSESIRNLVSDLENKHEIEEMLKEARFQALQSQINPHFLFNTLNAISRSVSFESPKVTQKLILSLSQLFRYTLEHNEHHSTVEMELEVVKRYLYIQGFRFHDRLSFSIDADPLCKDILIPKLTLQPIVENALIHGLESSDKKGHIHIQVKRRGSNILIRIFDNGIGIQKKRIQEILDPSSEIHTGDTTSVGILNIVNRLQYSNNGNLSIISKVTKWTIVKIVIPFKRTNICTQC